MKRYFNTEGQCEADIHYMVNIEERLKQIKELLVDRGKYFVINRGRQYGKTTTLRALAEYLKEEYIVVSLDFQILSTTNFENEYRFVRSFAKIFFNALRKQLDKEKISEFQESFMEASDKQLDMNELFVQLSKVCEISQKPIVMMIDEVDSASNNQVFIDFLAQLRQYYLARNDMPAFYSVILVGVYDIKNLKLKIRPDADHQYNSPWNIAADFDIDMSFSANEIAGMLYEYEADNQTGMDTTAVARLIYQYTSGYPYLVSVICKLIDEKLPYNHMFTDCKNIWSKDGIEEAVKILLRSKTTLFDSMVKHIYEYPDLKAMLYAMLFQGEQIVYNPYNHTIELACMFGYTVDDGVHVQVANRIFETCLYNLFLSEEELQSVMSKKAKQDRNQFVSNGMLDMEQILKKFVEHFHDVYGDNDERFIEEYGRKFFLLYLKPIINGTGNYYIEAQTRDAKRTDVIVDYLGEQFVIELKIWHGNEYNERGEEQLAGYLDYFHLKKGYMISFNFNRKKEVGVKTIVLQDKDKVITEATV